ncbi:MAG: FG-GAP-like repeat-containing protein [Candidatus Zhuqueibacterota bacterium]
MNKWYFTGILLLLTALPSQGQFTKQIGFFNPSLVESVPNHRFAFGDLDNDGDFDMIVGEYQGRLLFYRNTGSSIAPQWTQELFLLDDIIIPPISGPPFSTPVLADVDADADLDLIVGVRGSSTLNDIYFFRNTGTPEEPSWREENAIIQISEGEMAVPFLVDLDDDADLDMVIGDIDGTLHYYQNIGDAKNPDWVEEVTFFLSPIYIDVGTNSSPTLADMDNDADYDLLIGAGDGTLTYYENQGSADAPQFIEDTELFSGIDVGANSNPTLVDLDGDADSDLIIGNWDYGIFYFENTGSVTRPVWTRDVTAFAGMDIGFNSAPAIYDVNNDGLLDVVIGHKQSSLTKPLYTYLNQGAATAPVWNENTTAFPEIKNIFDRFVAPEFVDLDGDGDEEFVAGAWDGRIYCYVNIGDRSAPVWEYRPLLFLGIDIGNFSIPEFADLDADGDMDLTVGEENGRLACFWNRGTVQAPQFDIIETDTSIYGNIDIGSNSTPAFMDIDDDGDLDLIVGEYEGYLNLFENVGDASYPIWEVNTEFFQEINFDIDWFPIPKVHDINGDGRQDLIVGEQSGVLKLYLNQSAPNDDKGPSFSSFQPGVVYDTTAFFIRGVITDDDGVYDDDTGSDGSGVYLRWDNDGELTTSANELMLDRVAGDTFRTVTAIPAQSEDSECVFRVYAKDNNTVSKNAGVSSLYRIDVLDDDSDAPTFIFFSPDSVDENQSFYIEVGLADQSGCYDDETTSDGQGAYLRWDSDGELSATSSEVALNKFSEDLFRSMNPVPGQSGGATIAYQVSIFDDDFDNLNEADRAQGISSIRHVYVRLNQTGDDDDATGPTISAIKTAPAQVYDTTHFFIEAEITDASGVFDDNTGFAGQGVHVRWDIDGELNIDFQEQTMSGAAGDLFVSDAAIPSQFWGSHFVFQIFACDNDFDDNDPLDRKGSQSPTATVTILDDDAAPPVIIETSPTFVPVNTPFLIKSVIRDGSGVFDDDSGSAGFGVYVTWDVDGELLLSANETAMTQSAGDTFVVENTLPGLAAGSEFVFQIVAYDDDFDNAVAADRLPVANQVRNIVIYSGGDTDIQGPTFSNWQPLLRYDDESFLITGEIFDPSGVYDDATGSDGNGIYLLWDTDGELTCSANEKQVEFVSGNMYQTVDSIPALPADVDVVYQVFARDNDTNNGAYDLSLGISMAQVVRILDDDEEPPEFALFSPLEVYDSSEFYIECTISDSSGIYDDETGSDGFGVHLLMDTDGELSNDANEIEMHHAGKNRYRTAQKLSIPDLNKSLVYQIFAYDDDFDNQEFSDRKLGISLAQSIYLRDDDSEGPIFTNFEPTQIQTGRSFFVECDIFDSSGVFDDATGSDGQGVYLRWDRDGELDQSAAEIQLEWLRDNRYRTVSAIDALQEGDIFICQVFAYDNDFDNSFAADRKQSASSIRQMDFSNTEFRIMTLGVAPNPFSESTYFIHTLTKDADIEIELFTVSGERVIQLQGRYTRGSTAEIAWDGTNEAGNELASGVYMFRFVARAGGVSLDEFGKIAIVR